MDNRKPSGLLAMAALSIRMFCTLLVIRRSPYWSVPSGLFGALSDATPFPAILEDQRVEASKQYQEAGTEWLECAK